MWDGGEDKVGEKEVNNNPIIKKIKYLKLMCCVLLII